jgi:hypothetical protein
MLWLAASGPARGEPVDRILYVVDDRLVTSSDLVLEQVLSEHDPGPIHRLRGPEPDLEVILVDMAVVRALAGDVALYHPTERAVRERLESVRSSWVDPAGYQRFLATTGLDEPELSGILFSRMVVEQYLLRSLGTDSSSSSEAKDRYSDWIREKRRSAKIRAVEELPPPAR